MGSPYIFLSYRRGADQAAAGRVADRLRLEFGPNCVFLDVEQNEELLSRRFKDVLTQKVEKCTDFIALIGSDWIAQVPSLGNEKDWIRLETAQALARDNVRFFPLLVDEAQMPAADDLPESMRGLPEIGGTRVRHDQFQEDLDPVVGKIRSAQGEIAAKKQRETDSENNAFWRRVRNWLLKYLVAAICLTTIVFAISYYNNEEFRHGVTCYFTQEHVLVPC